MLSKVSVTGTDTLGLTKPLRQARQTTLKMPKKGIKRESQKERKKRFSNVEDIKADIKKQQNRPDPENVQNAQTKARLTAMTAIKQFMAEDMVVSEMSESVEKLSEYSDGSENVFSQEKWEQAIVSKETTVNIDGAMTLRKWKGKHPLTGENLAGTVVYWSMANRKMAQDIKRENSAPAKKAGPTPTKKRETRDGVLDDDFFDDDDF